MGRERRMPIKQVVCSICKETVNKAVTYHVGGTDRACRKHEGVEEKKVALHHAKAKKADEQIRKLERRREPVWGPAESAMVPKCWVCMNTGLRQQEFFLRVLVEMQKQEKIHGGPVNPFDPKNKIVLQERCIFILTKEKCEAAIPFIREEFRMLVGVAGGVVSICGPCCGIFKIEALPPLSLEQMQAGTLLSRLMKPAIEGMAVKELARDN